MLMLADGNILTKLVCDNTDCLSFIISLLDILTILFLAYCASFRVGKAVRIFGWVWAAVVVAGTVAVVAIHTCMFTLVSALFSALVLMAVFGVTFESITREKEEAAKAKEPVEEPKAAAPFVCPLASMQCAMMQQGREEAKTAPVCAETTAETIPAQPAEEEPAEEPKQEPQAAPVEQVAADSTEGLSLRESLAMARQAESAPAVINKQYIAAFVKKTFGDGAEVNTRVNYTKTGLPLADTHYAVRKDGKTCFVYVYETDAAVVLLLRVTDAYADSYRKRGHRINKSAFPKSKDAWYSLVVDGHYTEADVQEILTAAYNMAK